jgi:carnitine O-acetyltransferase
MRIGKFSFKSGNKAITLTRYSLQFNVVSKGLGSERMSFYLNEAAGDIRDLMTPTLEAPKAKL